jgi:predicted small metal-binding protein
MKIFSYAYSRILMETKSEPTLLTFKCRDAGHKACHWEGAAETEALLMFQIEQHARDQHNLIIEGSGEEKIRAAIKLKQ